MTACSQVATRADAPVRGDLFDIQLGASQPPQEDAAVQLAGFVTRPLRPSPGAGVSFFSVCWAAQTHASSASALEVRRLLVLSVTATGPATAAPSQAKSADEGEAGGRGLLPAAVALLLSQADAATPMVGGLQASLALVQHLLRFEEPPPLALLTPGSLLAPSCAMPWRTSCAAHGGVWGFSRSVRVESPRLALLHADASGDATSAEAVLVGTVRVLLDVPEKGLQVCEVV